MVITDDLATFITKTLASDHIKAVTILIFALNLAVLTSFYPILFPTNMFVAIIIPTGIIKVSNPIFLIIV